MNCTHCHAPTDNGELFCSRCEVFVTRHDQPPELIYVASPYTHPDPEVRERRYRAVLLYTSKLMKRGYYAFSPIVYGHHMQVPSLWTQWAPFDRQMLNHCTKLHVLCLDGWDVSVGVQEEIEWAGNKPILYVEPDDEIKSCLVPEDKRCSSLRGD